MTTTVLLQGSATPFDSTLAKAAFLAGRLLFGVVLGFQGLNHFTDTDQLAEYADAKGLPAPRAAVYVSGAALLLGGLGIVLGVLPAVSAAALAAFLLLSAVTVHDFWAVPDERTEDELTQFLKNVSLAGAALVFLGLSAIPWPYAL